MGDPRVSRLGWWHVTADDVGAGAPCRPVSAARASRGKPPVSEPTAHRRRQVTASAAPCACGSITGPERGAGSRFSTVGSYVPRWLELRLLPMEDAAARGVCWAGVRLCPDYNSDI